MSAGTCIGRLGPLAAALGIGAALTVAGAPVASADVPGSDTSATADNSSQSAPTARPRRARSSGSTRTAATGNGRGAQHRLSGPVESGLAPHLLAEPGPEVDVAITPARLRMPARPVAPGVMTGLLGGTGLSTDSPTAPLLPTPVEAAVLAFVRRDTSVAPASASAPVPQQLLAQAVSGGSGSTFGNQTPALRPVQIGQSAAGVVSGQLNATDPDSSSLTFSVTQTPVHGSVVVSANGSYAYTPNPALFATGTTDSFRVRVSDAGSGFHIHGLGGLINLLTFGLLGSSGHTGIATVAVTVAPFTPGNRGPVLGVPSVGVPNATTGVVSGSVSATDADGDRLTYSAPASTAKGGVSVNASTGAFTYTPTVEARNTAAAPGATAADRVDAFTVTVVDGRGGTASTAVTVAVSPTPGAPAPLAAFPGAEGFGAAATGGRGGSVLYVTNLNADGAGSLQWAIDQPGTKYILFKVSGLIDTQIHLTNGNVTIAGQTSPGGITIRGFVTDESPYQDQAVQAPADFAENWILQHIRIRPGLTAPGDDGLRLRYTRNAIVDHVSIGNALDEAIEISYSHDITVQNTIIAETVGGHSFYGGVLMNYSNPAYGFGLDNVSLHHNIFNRIEGRLPEGSRESAAAANSFMNLELSNNLYWDPRFFVALGVDSGVASGGSRPIYWKLNAVNNLFHTANSFQYGMFDDQILNVARNELFVSGNKMDLYPSRSDYQLFYCCNDYPAETSPDATSRRAQARTTRHPFPTITYTPTDQLRTYLLNNAGAWPRDPMDTRLMSFVASNTISGAAPNTNPAGDGLLPAYVGSPPAAPTDTDADGMPDSWEVTKGTNPAVANTNAHTLSAVGYTDLEVYLNELSSSRITGSV